VSDGRARAIAGFELRVQLGDPLTWVYAAVLFALPFAFTGTTAVDLVGERGAVPRTAPWSLAQALAGVTAFGQLITTFVAASAALRDDALRTRALLATTRVTRGEYLGGRFTGALATMLLLYAMLPLGAWLGARMPWAGAGAAFPAARVLAPWAVMILPNALLVSALFFAAGALTGHFGAILLLGVALVGVWQAGVALAPDAATAWAGALLDPFGNGALTAVTAGWSAAERATRAVPWDAGPIVANRALWLGIATLVAGWTLARWDFRQRPLARAAAPDRRPATRARASTPDRTPAHAPDRAIHPVTARAPRAAPRAGAQNVELFRFTLRELVTDRLFIALAGLGSLNGAFGAWRAGRTAPPAGVDATAHALGYVATHAQVFLLLVAAVWAGEVVWRERDVRADALRDHLPVRTTGVVAAKLLALALALLPLVLGLVAAAGTAAAARAGSRGSGDVRSRGAVRDAWPALVRLGCVAVALHALVQQKVAGHFALALLWLAALAGGSALGIDAVRWIDPLPVARPPAPWLAPRRRPRLRRRRPRPLASRTLSPGGGRRAAWVAAGWRVPCGDAMMAG
jgi:hypothetical protein